MHGVIVERRRAPLTASSYHLRSEQPINLPTTFTALGPSMSDSDLFTALGVVMAGLAALLAGYYSKKTVEFAKNAESSAQKANENASHANVISANAWIEQYLCNVRVWADEACENIARAMHAVHLSSETRDVELFEAMYRISSLVDRGRWFFPNQWNDEIGLHKEAAYRGLRQPILDWLVEAYDLTKVLLEDKESKSVLGLVHCQRQFVSEVQQVLNPRRREQEIERITQQFSVSEKLSNMAP
jgi:hypothetical protein